MRPFRARSSRCCCCYTRRHLLSYVALQIHNMGVLQALGLAATDEEGLAARAQKLAKLGLAGVLVVGAAKASLKIAAKSGGSPL